MLFSNKCTFMPRIYLNRVINVLNDNISPRVKFQDNAFFHSFFVSPFFLFMISSKIHSHYLYLSLNDIFHFWFFSVVHILFWYKYYLSFIGFLYIAIRHINTKTYDIHRFIFQQTKIWYFVLNLHLILGTKYMKKVT